MKGFLIYPTYELIDNKSYVVLFGRLENNQSFISMHECKPYFYIKKSDLKDALSLEDFEHENNHFKNFSSEEVIKVILNVPAEVPKLRKKLEENSIECYEADVRFEYRFLYDNNIQGGLDIDGDFTSSEKVDRIYKNPDIKGVYYNPSNLKVLSIDIESSKESSEIYCMSLVCGDEKHSIIQSSKKLKNAISCKDEEELLEKFIQLVNTIDPDVITGWNVIDFDLNLIYKRCKKYKVEFNLARNNSRCKLRIQDNFFMDSKADIPGRQVLDALHLMKVSFIKVNDYKLETVASQILGEGKFLKFKDPTSKYKLLDDLFMNDPQKLVDYNLKDAELVLKILDKTKVLELTIHRSLLTGMPLDRVNASIASLDSIYLKECIKRKLVAPTGKFSTKESPIKGGYVRESNPGIYDHILILDFKSLYPSIMRSFNIDPYSYVPDCSGKDLIRAPNNACFKNEDGILPEILSKLFVVREKARKEKDELTRYAIKILMNSFFGVLGNPSCRFFDMKMVNAITYFGQFIIKLTGEEIEKLGYKVIYQDTDSNFVVSNAKSLEEANVIGKKIEKHINDFYKDFINKEYNRESFLELNFEKCFIKCIMPKLRKSEAGAKKRYAGLVVKNNKEEIQFVGLEFIRADWTELAKKFQYELFDKIFHDKEVVDYVKNFLKDLKKGKYDELLIYKKTMRKEMEDYSVDTPTKKVVDKLLLKGIKLDSNIISYIMTEDGPEHIEHLKHKIDYDHYIDKQIRPIADAILIFFNTD
ncbi:MAG: DNA polymerase II, partial [Nanoarchaeota archaeon]